VWRLTSLVSIFYERLHVSGCAAASIGVPYDKEVPSERDIYIAIWETGSRKTNTRFIILLI
jgi:hypothetical protein